MSLKYIKAITFVFLLCAVAFAAVKNSAVKDQATSSSVVEAKLLAELDSFAIEQGDERLLLEKKEGKWVVASYGGYPADSAKVNSFLLKLSTLDASQKLPESNDGDSKLRLDEKSVREGVSTKVILGRDPSTVVLFFGNARTGAVGINPLSARGQFVKRENSGAPFLIPEPVNTSPQFVSWIQTTIANVLSANIVRIRQFSFPTANEKKLEYELSSVNEELSLADGIPEGSEYDGLNLNLIRGGLENLRLVGIEPSDSSITGSYENLYLTEFGVENGLVYEVTSLKKGDEYFIKLNARFDRKLRDLYAKNSNKDNPNADPKNPDYEPLVAEAEVLNSQYSKWLYKVDSYIAEKFLLKREQLVAKK